MRGVVWTAAIWGCFLLGVAWWQRTRGTSGWFRRENIALILALLGTHAVAGRTSTEEVLRDPVVIERVVRGGLAGIAVALALPLLIAHLRSPHPVGHRSLAALGAYVTVGAVSVLYSVAPVVTIAKVAELAAGLVAVAAITLADRPREGLQSTVQLVIGLEASLLAVAVLGFVARLDSFAQLQDRRGFITDLTMVSPYAHSNVLSSSSAAIAAFGLACFLERSQRRAWWLGLFTLGTVGTVLSSGRQGVAIWLASVLVLMIVHRRQLFLTVIAPTCFLVVVFAWDSITRAIVRGQPTTLGTLTGRLAWWQAAFESWLQHPWTGYGYGAGGRFVALQSLGASRRSSVHSGYFEALVGVGIFGLLPLLYALCRAGVWAVRSLLRRIDTAFAILLVPLILHTAIDQGFGAWLNEDFVLFACLAGFADIAFIARRSFGRVESERDVDFAVSR